MKTRGLVTAFIAVGAIVGVGSWLARSDGAAAGAQEVERRIQDTVREAGVVESAETTELRCELSGGGTILEIIPEGQTVKQGDVLVKFNDSALQSALLNQRIAAAQAEADVEQAKAALETRRLSREREAAVAELAVQAAERARERSLGEGGELEAQLKQVEAKIALAEQKQAAAARARERGEDIGLALAEARAAHDTAAARKQLLTEHVRPAERIEHQLAIARAKAEQERTALESIAAIRQAEAELKARQAALELERARLERISGRIEQTTIRAPHDGRVLYAADGGRRAEVDVIEEGVTVRERQPILRVVDPQQFQIRVRVHETRIGRVKKGQPAVIRIDAFPDRTFEGTVTEVGTTAQTRSWPNTDIKEYPVIISLDAPAPMLKLGLTTEVEIDVSETEKR
ncbi:MAG: HlyD family secretion protein [Planctomycetaceae bacterium]